MKKDLNVTCTTDLTELLEILRYWMVPEVLETCVDFLLFAFKPDNQVVLRECAIEYETTREQSEAASRGYVFILQFLYEELKCDIEGGILMAAEADQVGCLEYFHSRGEQLTSELAATAAKANSLQCLLYIHDFGGVGDFSTTLSAATNGSLECVKFLVTNGGTNQAKELDKLLYNSSKAGHHPVIEYLWDACKELRTPTCEYSVSYPAAMRGHLSLLQFAHARSFAAFGSPPNSARNLMTCAAQGGQLHSVEFLYSVGQLADAQIMTSASEGGNIPLVRFLLEHNCPIDPSPSQLT